MHIIIIITITHGIIIIVVIEESFQMGVSACKSDNITPSLAGSFDRRSLFGDQSGCNR